MPEDRGPDAVRVKLIEAASTLLMAAPPTEVTAKQIAEAAGVNHGQIHHYFGSKDGLVAATIADGAARYRQERLADGQRFPIPIDTAERGSAWRTLAYLASTGAWRQPPFEPSPIVETLATTRSSELGLEISDTRVLADVAGAIALQRGWSIFRDIIETALDEFSPDTDLLRAAVARRSERLIDESIPLPTTPAEHPLAPTRAPTGEGSPRGRDEVQASLITAAFELLVEQPPSQVTTKHIAEAAGVNHGQIHHYFSSKEQLIAHSVRFGASNLLQAIDDGLVDLPVPIRTERRSPIWRTLAHIAATEEWVDEAYGRSPVIRRMVEIIGHRKGVPLTSNEVHAQVAVVHALELGWAIYRNIIEYGLESLGGDLPAIRQRLAAMSCRLVDDDVRAI